MNFIISATTDIGLTKKTNQDSYNISVSTTSIGKVALAILCDGMGGLQKGEVASSSLVNAFSKWMKNKLPEIIANGISDSVIRSEWVSIITEYNEKIKNYGKSYGISLGTTATILLLTPTRYYIANVGDTRAYEIQNEVTILTKDQTLVAREVEMGIITPEEAETDPRRSVLLQCVGASDDVYPDLFFGETKKDAVYMLCTDGFRHEITEEEIYAYLNPSVMLDADGMKRNMDSLIEINKQREERDNITVLTVRTF